MEIIESKEYKNLLNTITGRVYQAQVKALKTINIELVSMYWDIGKLIVEKQREHKWGDNFIISLSEDLISSFQGKGDFSERNLYYIRDFYTTFSENTKVAQAGPLLPWGQVKVILSKKFSELELEYYVKSTIKNGWSRLTLESKIRNKDYESWAVSQSNTKGVLLGEQARNAELYMRDEVDLSFLDLEEQHKEYELEEKIILNITKFLSVMGNEFSFVGRQVPVTLDDKIYKIDLLFYHRSLRCLFIVELKSGEFKASDAAQLGVYITLADEKLKKEHENPTIGMVLCKTKSRVLVDITLKFMTKPMGVTTYGKSELPENIAKYLPSEEEISRKLLNLFNENENTDK